MKISFVIPAYNEESYIAGCLESVLSELKTTNTSSEIIVVNNASIDRTKAVAESFPDVRVVDEPVKGLARARHAGFVASSGELIANIDSDTRLPAGWLKTVLDEFARDEKLVALSGPFIYFDLPPFQLVLVRVFYFLGYAVYLVNTYVLRIGSMLQGGNYIVRRRALEDIGGHNYDEIDFYGEDSDIARRLVRLGKIKFTFKLPIYASGRRIVKEGILTMGFRYAANYMWMLWFKKPLTKTVVDLSSKK